MKIALFDYVFERDKPGITGLSDLVWTWAKHLIAFGHEVHIVAPYPPETQPPTGAIVHRFPVPPIGYRNVLGHLLIAWHGWRLIRSIPGIDLVQAPEYLSTGLFVSLNDNPPVVLKVPGNIYERIANGNPFDWSMTQVLKFTARRSALRCARVIVTSADMRYWWGKSGTPADHMLLIPDGVDIERFHPIADARAQVGWSPEKLIILYAGRLSREKGVIHLLEAFDTVCQRVPSTELHIIGDGPLRTQLHTEKDNVIFHPWVAQPELPLYYSAADVFVLPSYSEGLPRVMMEALACGTVFVGTSISGITDHIDHNENGLLVQAGDTAGLAETLIDILCDDARAQHIAAAGYRYAREHLSSEQAVKAFCEQIYAPIVAQKTR